MKRLFIMCIFLCFTLFLFGCEQTAAEDADTATKDTATSSVNTNEEEDTDADSTDEGRGDVLDGPSDEAVASAFDAAYTVYQWFDLKPLATETDSEGNAVFYTVGDNEYCLKVTDPAVSTMDELKAKVNKYFSADIAATLLDDGKYFGDSDNLYAIAADRGADITKGEILKQEVTARADESITYTVTVETVNPETGKATGSEKIDYLYEWVDGTWVFTTFQSIN
ncbi:MAG TPA: hypothetical protein PKD52_01320 [Clostridiales bacterium]|nr:hypothetical protein [Clostridiales bacterium]